MNTLLLVEDDEDTREVVGFYLARHGLEVHAVGTLGEARDALRRLPFAALMTDLSLPDGDGRSLLEGGRPAGLRCAVVVSGHASQRDRELTLAAGFDAHFCKPLDQSVITQLTAMFGSARLA